MMNKVMLVEHFYLHFENQLQFQQLNLEYQLCYIHDIFLDKHILHRYLYDEVLLHQHLSEILICSNIEQEYLVLLFHLDELEFFPKTKSK